ncbi:MAG TPA: hypothetical protein VNZ44_17210 [Pyrinomonadaceae bacterium]|nr:hypothetical protein [Pyrinomonadaceae bacterium]
MELRLEDLKEKLKELAGNWPGYVMLGSFVLYLLGYLCIRFHLTVLGIGTDLKVLDERYLFAGAKFLVYFFSTVASVVLLALVLSPVIGFAYRLMDRLKGRGRAPLVYHVLGIVLSVVAIQLVMKQCFAFSNLLVARRLPWLGLNLKALLTQESETGRDLYFVGLVALTLLSGAVLAYVRLRLPAEGRRPFLSALLAFLVGVQFLLLPVNYGVFIMDKQIPRVANLGGEAPLAGGQEAWLVWEGNEGVTYLVRGPEADPDDATGKAKLRRLVTVPKGDVKRTEIVGYDFIFARIFGSQ